MSATEKLKALKDAEPDGYYYLWAYYDQIVAVVDQFEAFVEIHERSRDPWKEIEERLRNVAPPLLTALEEALA